MKINIGNKMALYPMPILVIGTMANGKPTWTLCGHSGIVSHDHLLISLVKTHYINGLIKENNGFTINFVTETMLDQCDYIGSTSGKDHDKSNVFDYTISNHGLPIINGSPLVLECQVEQLLVVEPFENFIATISATYADESILDGQHHIDYGMFKPVLFEFPTYQYLSTGPIIAPCLASIKKKTKEGD